MMHDAFISYSNADKSAADAACATLEQSGIRCWMAPRDVRSGSYWPEEIVGAIDNSRVMVLIFSAEANISNQVLREVEKAIRKGIPIYPVRIENVVPTKSMELFLHSVHWLDALTPPLETHLQALARDVKTFLDSHLDPSLSENKPQLEVSSSSASAAGVTDRRHADGDFGRKGPQLRSLMLRRWWLIAALLAVLAICGGGATYYLASDRPNCESASACSELGYAYDKKEQWDDAIKAFKKTVDLRPDSGAYVDLGWAYGKKLEWDLAINAYSKAIQLDPKPNDPWLAAAYVDRGYGYAAQGNWSSITV